MKEAMTPKTNSVTVLSAAAATGHLRAADALVAAFAARGVYRMRHRKSFPLCSKRRCE